MERHKSKLFISGLLAAAANLALMAWLVHAFRLNNFLGRALANVLAVEGSFLLGFILYRFWIWPPKLRKRSKGFLAELLIYHSYYSPLLLIRTFILFPFLDISGLNYFVNTLAGIGLSALRNLLPRLSTLGLVPKHPLYRPESLLKAVKGTKKKSISPARSSSLTLLSVIIPAHNEEEVIASTLCSLCGTLEKRKIQYEILVVSDHSTDGTRQAVKKIADEDKAVRLLINPYPSGYGFAVRMGLENFKGDAVAIVMADASDDPEDLAAYYEKLREGYDCVFGSRFIAGGGTKDYPIHKLALNRLANHFIKFLFQIELNDTTNAFKIYRRKVIEGIKPLISHHFNLTVEMPLKAIARGFSYAVIPIKWRNRTSGISKLKIKEMGSRYLFIVLSVFMEKMLTRGDYMAGRGRNRHCGDGQRMDRTKQSGL